MKKAYPHQSLLQAIKSNNKQRITTFLKDLKEDSQQDANLTQNLIEASLDYTKENIFNLFTSNGFNPINREKLLNAQLRFAAKNGNLELTQDLIACNIDLNLADSNGNLPLMFAAQNEHLEVIKFLADSNANINQQDAEGWTALFFAAYNYKPEAVELLIHHKADVNHNSNEGFNALISMLDRNPSESFNEEAIICKQLMLAGTDVNSIPIEKLRSITQKKHFEVKYALMEGKISRAIQTKNESELFSTVKYLMSHELLKNIPSGTTSLMLAAGAGYNHLVIEILNADAQIDQVNLKGYTALTYASVHNKIDVVKELLERKANVNHVSFSDDSTALHHAVFKGNLQVASLLLKHKADLNLKDLNDKTPLDIAKEKGWNYQDIENFIIGSSQDLDSADEDPSSSTSQHN